MRPARTKSCPHAVMIVASRAGGRVERSLAPSPSEPTGDVEHAQSRSSHEGRRRQHGAHSREVNTLPRGTLQRAHRQSENDEKPSTSVAPYSVAASLRGAGAVAPLLSSDGSICGVGGGVKNDSRKACFPSITTVVVICTCRRSGVWDG